MTEASARTLAQNLDKLQTSKPKPKKAEPVDSWEDEADDDYPPETEQGSGTGTPMRPGSSSDSPAPPPPTPSSPSFVSKKGSPFQTFPPYGMEAGYEGAAGDEGSFSRQSGEDRRPEKSTAVASRLIAAGIGQKAPKRTKEQREYDQAMKVQEKKRRDQAKVEEKKRKAEKEKAKQAIWED
jgi:hypothetical protein